MTQIQLFITLKKFTTIKKQIFRQKKTDIKMSVF